MKLSDLKPKSKEIEIIDPAGNPTGFKLQLISKDNPQCRSKQKEIMQLRQDQVKLDLDQLERFNIELSATCIVGWSGLTDDQGNPVPFSHERAIEMLSISDLTYVRLQIESFIDDLANFFPKSTAAASSGSDATGKTQQAEQTRRKSTR